jgi:threonyl-tRNA synthetase
MPKKTNSPKILNYSAAQITVAAVLKLFPQAKLAGGKADKKGFFYDFDLAKSLTPKDLPAIEKEIRKIINEGKEFEKQELGIKEAKNLFPKKKQPYQLELLEEIKKEGKKKIRICKIGKLAIIAQGDFLPSTQKIKSEGIKLAKISGVYWKGNEKNKMLQRIYGVAFESKTELEKHLSLSKETEARDHRKLGKELDLFVFSDLVGPGLPLFTPKGTFIINKLREKIEEICQTYGYEKVITPHLAKIDLYKISGHADKFKEELFQVTSRHKQNYVLKPVQCPHQIQIYASKPRSYRDLPIRYMESEKQYRAEKPGEIGGLNRVIAITVEDGHSFCRINQVKDEIKNIIKIIKDFYRALGLWKDHWVSLSFRDYKSPEKYIGEVKDWKQCEKILEEINVEMKLDAKKCIGEAALYGPKIDFMFQDITGKEIQIPTIQLDFATPKAFNLSYTDEKGKSVVPIMVHRAILGSYERLLALLIEHFAGAFPVWLAPVQIVILPVSAKFNNYGKSVMENLQKNGLRVELNDADTSLGKKISQVRKQKIPYALIVGEKEMKAEKVAVRSREKGDEGAVKLGEFIKRIKEEIEDKD